MRLPNEKTLSSIQDYFNLNLSLLKNHQQCSLPGYKTQEGIVFGINPIIMPDCSFSTIPLAAQADSPEKQEVKLLFGDNVRLERNCDFEGPAIIGNHVIIEENVHVKHSIIFDNSYLSHDLELIDKIVESNTVIDPINNIKLVIEEDRLLASTKPHLCKRAFNYIGRCMDYIFALWLMIHLLICYSFFLCFCFSWTSYSRFWFCKFSLDKFTGVLQCLRGQKKLVGCAYPPSEAALFTYSESLQNTSDPLQLQLDDQYFKSHDNVWFRLSIILSILIRRFFQHNEPENQN